MINFYNISATMSAPKRCNARKSVQNSDPGKILDLLMSLNTESCSQLQININLYLEDECEAELAFLVVVNSDRMEAFIEAVGKHDLTRKYKLRVSEALSQVLRTNRDNAFRVGDLRADFVDIISPFLKDDFHKKNILMQPIIDKPFTAIVCVVGYTMQEETLASIIHECFLFSWPALKKSIALDYETTLKKKCQQLLKVARRMFSQVESQETLLHLAMEQAKQLTKAAFCVVLLVDVETMELVDSCSLKKTKSEGDLLTERRFPINTGITGQVLNKGTAINVCEPQSHPSFNPSIDGYPGIECKQLLCFPIREQTGIIGVGQLINKIGDPYFDGMDEEVCMAFSVYCGICIVHSVVYHKIEEAHIRNILANELVMYHMKVSDSEVNRIVQCTGFHNQPHFANLHFNSRALPLRELPCYVYKMFTDLGFDKTFHIRPMKLACFILHTKKSYRDVPYHNWIHGFNVAQWAYAAIHQFKLIKDGYLGDLQALMYLVAALVHDLDHRGTTNSYQIRGRTPLASLYSSEGSVMERHHLAQALCILNTESCDILENLPRKDYDRALVLLKENVLATDLANFFKNLNELNAISIDFQKGNRLHRSALQCLLMNSADLSDQLKDWASVKKTAACLLTEFFNEGDEEKNRGEFPALAMDRDKCFIPELEINFLTSICSPLFELLSRILPRAFSCITIINNHAERWNAAKPVFAEVPIKAGLSVLLSPELDNLIEINLKEIERMRLEAENEVQEEQ